MIENKFRCEYLMYCLGTSFVYGFFFLKRCSFLIFFQLLIYLFQNGLIDILTLKGSHIKKYNAHFLRMLNLGS